MEGLIEGRIVHFVLPNGEHRPAIVVKVWSEDTAINLRVFLDGINDKGEFNLESLQQWGFCLWRPSVPYSEEPLPNTWHWIEQA